MSGATSLKTVLSEVVFSTSHPSRCRRGLPKRVLEGGGARRVLGLHKQLLRGDGAGEDGVQAQVGAGGLLQGEADQRSRPALLLRADGEAGAAVSAVHHVSAGEGSPSLIDSHTLSLTHA